MITPGRNIAIKVPTHQWEDTVAFYRDRAGLKVTRELEASIAFEFGGITLWIDRVPHQSQSDFVWQRAKCGHGGDYVCLVRQA